MSQLARKYILNIIYIRNQTICVDVIKNNDNSQITKARNNFYYYYDNKFKSHANLELYKKYVKQWKFIIVSKWVGISEAIRLILMNYLFYFYSYKFVNFNNLAYIDTPHHQGGVGIYKFSSENLEKENNETNIGIFKSHNKEEEENNIIPRENVRIVNSMIHSQVLDIIKEFKETKELEKISKGEKEWLAGLIDGDGYFELTKQGICRFSIVMDARDKIVLHKLEEMFGGSIYQKSKAKAFKYQLSGLKRLIKLILCVNGEIRNPKRLLQLEKLCYKYGIELKMPKPLSFNNGWLSGFIDSDGSVYCVKSSRQVNISASQKDMYILEPLVNIYGGKIYRHSSKKDAFKYQIYKHNELFNLIDNYFSKYPLYSMKKNRITLIREVVDCFSTNPKTWSVKEINRFMILKTKWDNYS